MIEALKTLHGRRKPVLQTTFYLTCLAFPICAFLPIRKDRSLFQRCRLVNPIDRTAQHCRETRLLEIVRMPQ